MNTAYKLVSRSLTGICSVCLVLALPAPARGEDLRFRVLAAQGQTATGSGIVDSVPDGTFYYFPGQLGTEFGAPSAGSGGFAAFRGWAEFPPQPPLPVRRGSWGAGPGAMSLLTLSERPAPGTPGGRFSGLDDFITMNDSGDVAFGTNWTTPTGVNPRISGTGIWWGLAGAGPTAALVPVAISGTTGPGATTPFTNLILRPLHNGGFIGFTADGAHWVFDKLTRELQRVAWPGMPAPSAGGGVTIANSIVSLGLDAAGRMLLQGNGSDGSIRIFRAGGTAEPSPVVRFGQDAPGVPGKKIGGASVGLNHLGEMAMGAYITDDDGIFANDFSAVYYGTDGNMNLLVRGDAPIPGMPAGVWGGKTYLGRKGHIFAAGGMFKVPDKPADPLTFTAIPVAGYTGFSINALGQIAASSLVNNLTTLSFFNPGDGWREVARQSRPVPLPGGDVNANALHFLLGSGGGDGIASSLTNDGRLVFSIGSHIVSVDANPSTGFVFHGEHGINWHALEADPPTNWNATDGTPREELPGDVEKDTAEVSIPAGFFVALFERAAPIGFLRSLGRLTLQQALTVHRDSVAEELIITGANGRLNVDGAEFEATGDWRVESGGSISLTNATLLNRKKLTVESGLLTATGDSLLENHGLLEKTGAGLFEVKAPLHQFGPALNNPLVREGTLALTGGGDFKEDLHLLRVERGATLRLLGDWTLANRLEFANGNTTGLVELGDATHDVEIQVADSSDEVTFSTGARFRRGRLRGAGVFKNGIGEFTWEGGEMGSGGLDGFGRPVGGFRNLNRLELPDPPQAPRSVTGLLVNRSQVTHRGPVTLDGGVLLQDSQDAVWTMKGGRIEGSPDNARVLNLEGRIIAEDNSEIHARYEDAMFGTLLVRNTLSMYGGADFEGQVVLESDFSELMLDSAPGPRRDYILHQGLGEPNEPRARLVIKNARLRLPNDGEGRLIVPPLTLGENSQIMNDLPLISKPVETLEDILANFEKFIVVGNLEWNGGVIGGSPPASQTFIRQGQGKTLNISGAAEHFLDAVAAFNQVTQRSRVTVAENGSILLERPLYLLSRWTIAAPVDLIGSGTFVNASTLAIQPDPPGPVEIGLRVVVTVYFFGNYYTGEFICGSPDRDNTGTVARFTNTVSARPEPGDLLLKGTWRVHSGAVLDLGGPPLHQLAPAATVELIGGQFLQLDPRQNDGHLFLRAAGNSLEATDYFENNGHLEISDDASFHVRGAAGNLGIIRLTRGGSMTIDGLFTQQYPGFLTLGLCTLNLPAGGVFGGSVTGEGIIVGDITLPGQASPGTSPGELTVTGNATLTPTTVLDIELAGLAEDQFDVFSVSREVKLDGALGLLLLDGYRPAAGDSFAIVRAGTVTGQFANAPSGQRLATADGYGSFLVSYTANAVVLSAFAANPNPPPSAPPKLPAPEILFAGSSEPLLSFQISGTPGRPYRIESSADLLTWAPFQSAVLNSSGALVEVPFDAADSPRYFRARAE